MHEEEPPPFYGETILRDQQQEYIEGVLAKFKKEPVSEDLKKKIYDELQKEKFLGRITIPFKVVLRQDPSGKFPETIEVIVDTKV